MRERIVHRTLQTLAFVPFVGGAAPMPADIHPSVTLSRQGSDVRLNWSGGKPKYQLQRLAPQAGTWTNVGPPTTASTAALPISEDTAFFRVIGDYTARFEVTFDATWSAQTHPGAWPAGAHWSGPVGGVHNDQVQFWAEGKAASEGIRLMAERGQQATLVSEIQAGIPTGKALFTMTASGLSSPAQRIITFPQATTRDFPLLTLCSMVAPSPDWFVGVSGLSLIGADGGWIPEQTVALDGYDAGSDSGADFTSPDLATQPRSVVKRFNGYPALIQGAIVPFGTFTIRRIE